MYKGFRLGTIKIKCVGYWTKWGGVNVSHYWIAKIHADEVASKS